MEEQGSDDGASGAQHDRGSGTSRTGGPSINEGCRGIAGNLLSLLEMCARSLSTSVLYADPGPLAYKREREAPHVGDLIRIRSNTTSTLSLVYL